MSGVIGPLLEAAEMSDDGSCRRRVTAVDVVFPHIVYTDVRMLEKHRKNCHFCHFSGPAVRLVGGKVHSATRCSIMRSDMTRARPGHPSTEWRGCTENAISISADRSLTQHSLRVAVYSSGQTLEKGPQNYHFYHFSAPPARLPGAKVRSASHSVRSKSDLSWVFLGAQDSSWV